MTGSKKISIDMVIHESCVLGDTEKCDELFWWLLQIPKDREFSEEKFGEAYLGHITGAAGLPKEWKTLFGRGANVKVDVAKTKFYKINDMLGETRNKKNWHELTMNPLGEKIVASASDLLIKMLGGDPPSPEQARLQCNVNYYLENQQLNWHRDDRKPEPSTFLPASVTLFLLHPSRKGIKGGEFAYVFPTVSRAAKIDLGKKNKPDLEVVNSALSKLDTLSGPRPIVSEKLSRERDVLVGKISSPGNLIGLCGNAYTHGLHKNMKTFGDLRPKQNEPDRISLTFRFLLKSAYKDLLGKDW